MIPVHLSAKESISAALGFHQSKLMRDKLLYARGARLGKPQQDKHTDTNNTSGTAVWLEGVVVHVVACL